jgi:hypothetical protein
VRGIIHILDIYLEEKIQAEEWSRKPLNSADMR